MVKLKYFHMDNIKSIYYYPLSNILQFPTLEGHHIWNGFGWKRIKKKYFYFLFKSYLTVG